MRAKYFHDCRLQGALFEWSSEVVNLVAGVESRPYHGRGAPMTYKGEVFVIVYGMQWKAKYLSKMYLSYAYALSRFTARVILFFCAFFGFISLPFIFHSNSTFNT